jgi:hypothetical protein
MHSLSKLKKFYVEPGEKFEKVSVVFVEMGICFVYTCNAQHPEALLCSSVSVILSNYSIARLSSLHSVIQLLHIWTDTTEKLQVIFF